MATGAGDGESTASFLRGVALFAELTEDLRHELALAAERVDLPAGEWLFRQGDAADGLYVVDRVEGLEFEELQRLTGIPLVREAAVRAA